MSTAEAIRIGTAATGRIITAAATVLAVVAGSFIFSDLVMMKYLAFGLMAALLLDATVIRMFLVPSVMKLLGDDCWWAPMWMRRLQNRIGLGEIHLPDERKRPVPRARADRPAVAARPDVAAKPRPPHDPTHPGAEARPSPRPARPAGPAPRPEFRPPAQDTPSAAGTTRMRALAAPEPKEPPTTRFSAQPNRGAVSAPRDARRPAATPHRRPDRAAAKNAKSSPGSANCGAAAERPPGRSARHASRRRHRSRLPIKPARCRFRRPTPCGPTADAEDDATTAIPTAPRDEQDPDVATQKLNARGTDERRRRTDPSAPRRWAQRSGSAAPRRPASSPATMQPERLRRSRPIGISRRIAFRLRLIRFGLDDGRFCHLRLPWPRPPDPWPAAPGTRC